jgi:hypothetical protein
MMNAMMKNKLRIPALLPVLALLATGYVGAAAAHTQSGALGKAPAASDIYQITCPEQVVGVPPRLDVQVRDLKPKKPPFITVTMQKDLVGVSSMDPKDGDARFSPLVSIDGGAGSYLVIISKTAVNDKKRAFKEIYTLQYHCMSGALHTGTDIFTLQNQ